VWARIICAVVLFFALDSALFRTGWYASVLEPNSTAGFLESCLWIEQHRPIRAADPDARRYAAIVIPFDTYDDRNWEDLRDREIHLRYLAPLASLRDFLDFALSYPGWPLRGEAAATVLFKGLIYREDFQDLLVRHKARLAVLRDLQSRPSGWRYDVAWETQSLAGICRLERAHTLRLPEYLAPKKRDEIREVLLTDQPPRTGEFSEYRRGWARLWNTIADPAPAWSWYD